MKHRVRREGFTTLEAMISAAVLAIGLAAAAQVFSYTVLANYQRHQRSVAAIVLAWKLESFRSAQLTDSRWIAGGSLDPHQPDAGYFDYAAIGKQGELTVQSTALDAGYLSVWKIDRAIPRSVTVVVYIQRTAPGGYLELARGVLTMSPAF